MPISDRAIRVYAVLNKFSAGSADILEATMPLFEPILSEYNGKLLDTSMFAKAVKDSYKWNFTSDIAEELIPYFIEKNWLQELKKNNNGAIYKVTCDTSNLEIRTKEEKEIGGRLQSIASEFKAFITDLSPLSGFSRPIDDLKEMLIEWLISIDAYSEGILDNIVNETNGRLQGKLTLNTYVKAENSLNSDERYLCARFTQHLFNTKSLYVHDLCRIASIGLITEVIRDFNKPTSNIKKTDLVLFLDARIAMELLGVSGKAAEENIAPLINSLIDIGATVRILRSTVEEIENALVAVLKKTKNERTGPTAEAIIRGEVMEEYVSVISRDIEQHLKGKNVSVIDRLLKQYPGEHPYFTFEQFQAFIGKMPWQKEYNRREKDSFALCQIMRMRKGVQNRDLFMAKYILLTNNGSFVQSARKFCHEDGLLRTNNTPPLIHQRQLATLVWLRTGYNRDDTIPRRHILASCEKILTLNPRIIDQVDKMAKTLTKDTAEQFKVLLTEDKSRRYLMDKCLGSAKVISDQDPEALLSFMKQSLVSDIQEESDKKIAIIGSEKKAVSDELLSVSEKLKLADMEDQKLILHHMVIVNKKAKRVQWGIKGVMVVIIALTSFKFQIFGIPPLYLSLFSGGVTFILLYMQIIDKSVKLDKFFKWLATKQLNQYAKKIGIEGKLKRFCLTYDIKLGFILDTK